jgi:hypothetical protein
MKLLCIYLEKSTLNNHDVNVSLKTYPIHRQEYEELEKHINKQDNSVKISYLKTMPSSFMNKLYPDILSQDNKYSILVNMYLIYDNITKDYPFALIDSKL